MFENMEIEIRVPLDERTFSKVKEKLVKSSEFVKDSHQVDEYFTPAHRNFMEPHFPFEYFSVRRRGDKVILNYKHWHPENVEEATYCDEFETIVENGHNLEKMLTALNFKSLVIVEKEREIYTHNDEFEIALDTVKDLGHFIEVEAMKSFGSEEETRKKLFGFAENLGVDITKADNRGYPFLMMKKKGLIHR